MSAWEKDSDVVENIQEKEDDGRMSDVWRKLRFISHHFRSTLLFLNPLHDFLLQQIFHRQTYKRQAQIRQTLKDTVFALMKKSPVITASA